MPYQGADTKEKAGIQHGEGTGTGVSHTLKMSALSGGQGLKSEVDAENQREYESKPIR